LPESKRHAGNVIEEISIRQNQDDSTDIISAQRWASRKAYEDYFKWRTGNCYTAQFEEMLEQPLAIPFFDEMQDFPYWTRVISPDWAHCK
jgi:hypothetical protein